MNITAKMKCSTVKENGEGENKYSEEITLYAVYSDDPTSENYSFSQATPSAGVTMTITNKSAWGAFVQDQEYLVNFSPAK